MLKQRVVTAAIVTPLAIFLIWVGDPWFSVFIAAVVLLGTLEFYRISANLDRRQPLVYLGLLWALALALSPHYKNTNILPIVVTTATVISLVWLLCSSAQEEAFRNWAWVVAGVLYVGWLLGYWLSLRILPDGRGWVYLAMFTTFANDTSAFFIGRAWGKRKLIPISPAKTWEGALGGLLIAIVVAVAISRIPILFSLSPLKYWQAILLGCLISVFAQLGDLVESLLKRNMSQKESGKLLPGHGGILDRFDSLIFTGVVVYYYVVWVMMG
jgi:phosphatidate cytidylyltransferase